MVHCRQCAGLQTDRRTGHGLYLYSSGNRYKGDYRDNKKVGKEC